MLKLCLLQVTSCAVVVVILSNWPRLIAAAKALARHAGALRSPLARGGCHPN